MYRCPYCNEKLFEKDHQYCPLCGHLIQIIVHDQTKQYIISIKKSILLLIIAFFSYFLISFILHVIGLRIGIYFLASFSIFVIVLSGLYFISEKTQHVSLKEYFPENKAFMIFIVVLLWLIEFLNIIIINFIANKDIVLASIYQLSIEFILGCFCGLIITHFVK